MDQLYVKKPIYPLLSLLSSVMIFIAGLFLAKSMAILWLFLGLTLLYLAFGYGKTLLRGICLFSVIGIVVGLGAYATSGLLVVGIQTFSRILLLAYASIVMVALPPIEMTRNLIQLKVPRLLTLGMLITVRFIPLLIEESKHIRLAMKTRGVNSHFENLYRAFFIPFITRLISISDTMAVSLETRSFSIEEHRNTIYKPVKFKIRDGFFAFLLSALLIGVLYV